MKEEGIDPCDSCGGPMKLRRVTVDQRRGKDLVVVEHVPASVCVRCHRRHYDADVVQKLLKILSRRTRGTRKVKVPVFRFDAVA
jgi:YgiT-type zinc finger domain-containing protein